MSAENTGCVETMTTELAIVVSAREEIQVAQWRASSRPDASARIVGCPLGKRRVAPPRAARIGRRSRVEKPSRWKAMTSGGAWDKRPKMVPQQPAHTPTARGPPRENAGRDT